ncbi:MAG: hypothetical protein APR63_05770 [Desulfuromonas sp. SDB]|nr:MAG: hypothetical protein APR63_05770 [Desulfuromonas sp. SDB]
MRKFIELLLLLMVLATQLSGEGLLYPPPKLVVFDRWVLDVDHLKLMSVEDTVNPNIVWDVNQEPRLWDQPELGMDGVNFPVYYEDGSLLGNLMTEPVMPESHTITGSQISLKVQPDDQILWTYNPDPPLFYGKYLKVILDGSNLYIAIYHPISTGSGLVCLDAKTGEEIWRGEGVQLMIGHSQYMNEVYINLIDDKIVMVGDEAGGSYIQVFDAQTGERQFYNLDYQWEQNGY